MWATAPVGWSYEETDPSDKSSPSSSLWRSSLSDGDEVSSCSVHPGGEVGMLTASASAIAALAITSSSCVMVRSGSVGVGCVGAVTVVVVWVSEGWVLGKKRTYIDPSRYDTRRSLPKTFSTSSGGIPRVK